MSILLSRADLDFLLYDWLKIEELTARERYADHSRETFDATLDLAEAIATEHFLPHNKKADANEPRFENGKVMIPEVGAALKHYSEAGLLAAQADAADGGMQLPCAVGSAAFAFFKAANVGTASYPMLTTAASNLLRKHGSPELIARFLKPMREGRFFGTMCLSEPQAGSSLADITTRAEPQEDGSYRLFGTKMWISGGEHELSETIVHMVLAKVPGGPAGSRGISLFLVPKHLVDDDGAVGARNDVVLAGLNHKMGYRGTTNTLLNFGEGAHTPGGKPGAVGWLVGEVHGGLPAMFFMMNEARIGVGLGAVALGYAGYLRALAYAKERPQGRPLGVRDQTTKPCAIIEHPDVRRMLLASKSYVEGALAFALYCARLVDEERTGDAAGKRDAQALLDLLTPIAKSWPSQWCLAANDLAIQVHGGYGYTRDYDVEQLYRDNRLNPIHEGTHGIQALDLLGRKVTQNGGAALELFSARIAKTVREGEAAGGEAAGHARDLAAALDAVGETTRKLYGAGDLSVTLANASAYMEAFGHMAIAWVWLEQMLALGSREDAFAEGKLPKIFPQLATLAALDRTTLDMKAEWF
jgi:alkylation response protein AidB-like acyl-CoA dehydrogenase